MIAYQVDAFLNRLRVGRPVHVENLTVVPLLKGGDWGPEAAGYLTLDEGLASGQVKLREVGLDGIVSAIELDNLSGQPVLILDGEELSGAKQNRVPNSTILVPARSTIRVPVSCVEAGRWSYRSEELKSSGHAHFHFGRAAKLASVAAFRELCGRARADQRRVWDDIDLLAEDLRAYSATSAMSEIFDQRQDALDRYSKEITSAPDQVGALFAIGGRIEGVEVFDRPATLFSLLDKLVESYAVGALRKKHELGIRISAGHVRSFLNALHSPNWSSYPGIGIGTELHLKTEEIISSALALDEQMLHLAAFRAPPDHTQGGLRWDQDSFDQGADNGPEFDLAA
jgi:hypothetical protein